MTPLTFPESGIEFDAPCAISGGYVDTLLRADSVDAINAVLTGMGILKEEGAGTATRPPRLKKGAEMAYASVVTAPATYSPPVYENLPSYEWATDEDGTRLLDEDGQPYRVLTGETVKTQTGGGEQLTPATVDARLHVNFRLDPNILSGRFGRVLSDQLAWLEDEPAWTVNLYLWTLLGADEDDSGQNNHEAAKVWQGVSVIDPTTVSSPSMVWA